MGFAHSIWHCCGSCIDDGGYIGRWTHKRGYRRLRMSPDQNLAAAMLMVSRFAPFSDEALVDPVAGQALIRSGCVAGLSSCSGLNRSFASENGR